MIRLICVGKIKKKYVKDGVEVFLKRLQKYNRCEYIETNTLKEYNGFSIALDVEGKQISSEKFAELIKKIDFDYKNINFYIGGAEGLEKDFLETCDMKISLSKMTFPNELVRVIFLEQLYRAFTINNNEPYHKY
jgi:23S rRNA (pseudouridine1915-N3)-methyltransferase